MPSLRRPAETGCYAIRIVKLNISLPDDQVAFLDAYARSHGIQSRSGAIQAALRLLRTSQLDQRSHLRHRRILIDLRMRTTACRFVLVFDAHDKRPLWSPLEV